LTPIATPFIIVVHSLETEEATDAEAGAGSSGGDRGGDAARDRPRRSGPAEGEGSRRRVRVPAAKAKWHAPYVEAEAERKGALHRRGGTRKLGSNAEEPSIAAALPSSARRSRLGFPRNAAKVEE
jgi:hypothetical protein